MNSKEKGLYGKYTVTRNDLTQDDCFVLKPNKDPAARIALKAYAEATTNKALAQDIYNWIGESEVQE